MWEASDMKNDFGRKLDKDPLHQGRPNVVLAWKPISSVAPCYFEVRAANNPDSVGGTIASVQFQDGFSDSKGHIPGAHNEDVLLMVLDRLRACQNTQFRCRENALAITKIEEALMVLNMRTEDRKIRKVHDTDKA